MLALATAHPAAWRKKKPNMLHHKIIQQVSICPNQSGKNGRREVLSCKRVQSHFHHIPSTSTATVRALLAATSWNDGP
jgi:hypothetical protein